MEAKVEVKGFGEAVVPCGWMTTPLLAGGSGETTAGGGTKLLLPSPRFRISTLEFFR